MKLVTAYIPPLLFSLTLSITTVGILPPLGTGTPSLGGHPLTGHGPAIQPQPGSSNAGVGNASNETSAPDPDTSAGNATDSSPPDHLAVLDYQYISNDGSPRVDITVTYGAQNLTQSWEVRNGTLYQVGSNQGSMAVEDGSGAVNSTVGTNTVGAGTNMGTGTPPPQAKPNAARPGFTGPKLRARA
ncbi:MAG: hypothetical protein Q9219_001356 [cf. Caloplaca sp. 3 TL-2023]